VSVIEPQPCAGGGGEGGVTVHNLLTGRSAATAHPTSAITGLDATLAALAGAPYIVSSASGTLTGEMLIGAVILPPDVIADRPAANTVPAGAIFFATDTEMLFRSTGAAWETFSIAVDGLGVTYPLTIDSTTSPGTEIVEAWTVPHMEATPAGVTVTSTAAETSLLSAPWAVAANEIKIGDVIEFCAWGSMISNAGGDNIDIRLRFGGVAGAVVVNHDWLSTVPPGAVARAWSMQTYMYVLNATTWEITSQLALTAAGGVVGGGPGVADLLFNTRNGGPSACDLTIPNDFILTAQPAESTASISITCVRALFKHIQARP
jgi:hypothetical protein